MRWIVSAILGFAAALAWLAIWAFSLHLFGIAAFERQAKDRASRRERIKQMGKLRYILIFGLLGYGLAFGLAVTVNDWLVRTSHDWVLSTDKFVMSSVLYGWFYGAMTWRESFRDPVPFPPDYPPPK